MTLKPIVPIKYKVSNNYIYFSASHHLKIFYSNLDQSTKVLPINYKKSSAQGSLDLIVRADFIISHYLKLFYIFAYFRLYVFI
jgi:hypothetical protein